jgi:hypothetical protein
MTGQTPGEHVHDLLLEHINLELQPGICDSVAEALFAEYVPKAHADERYQDAIQPTIDVLEWCQALLRSVVSWQGPQEWRDDQVAHIDDLIKHLSSPS